MKVRTVGKRVRKVAKRTRKRGAHHGTKKGIPFEDPLIGWGWFSRRRRGEGTDTAPALPEAYRSCCATLQSEIAVNTTEDQKVIFTASIGSMLVEQIRDIRLRQPARAAICALVALFGCGTGRLCGVACHGGCDNPKPACKRFWCGPVHYVSGEANGEVAREGANSLHIAADQSILFSRQPKANLRKRKGDADNLKKPLPVWYVTAVEPTEEATLFFLADSCRHVIHERGRIKSAQARIESALNISKTVVPTVRVTTRADCPLLFCKLTANIANGERKGKRATGHLGGCRECPRGRRQCID